MLKNSIIDNLKKNNYFKKEREMKKAIVNLFILLVFLVITIAGPINLWADEGDRPSISADVAVLSKHIWRGFELSDDSIVVQPSATLEYKGFSVNVWGNLETAFDNEADSSDNSTWNEIDFTIAYDRSFGKLSVGVGYIWYALSSLDDSRELYLSLGVDTLLSPTITVYREVSLLPSWYVNFGISHSIDLPREMTLDFSGSAGYYYSDDDDFSEAKDASEKYREFHDALLSVGLTIPLGEYASITPTLAYSFPLSNKADDLITNGSFPVIHPISCMVA
jgi:hypothetical protein